MWAVLRENLLAKVRDGWGTEVAGDYNSDRKSPCEHGRLSSWCSWARRSGACGPSYGRICLRKFATVGALRSQGITIQIGSPHANTDAFRPGVLGLGDLGHVGRPTGEFACESSRRLGH